MLVNTAIDPCSHSDRPPRPANARGSREQPFVPNAATSVKIPPGSFMLGCQSGEMSPASEGGRFGRELRAASGSRGERTTQLCTQKRESGSSPTKMVGQCGGWRRIRDTVARSSQRAVRIVARMRQGSRSGIEDGPEGGVTSTEVLNFLVSAAGGHEDRRTSYRPARAADRCRT